MQVNSRFVKTGELLNYTVRTPSTNQVLNNLEKFFNRGTD